MIGPVERYRIKGGHMRRAQRGAYCMAEDADAVVAEALRIRSAAIEAIVNMLESIDHEAVCDVFDRVGRPKRPGEDADLREQLDDARAQIAILTGRLEDVRRKNAALVETQRRAAQDLMRRGLA